MDRLAQRRCRFRENRGGDERDFHRREGGIPVAPRRSDDTLLSSQHFQSLKARLDTVRDSGGQSWTVLSAPKRKMRPLRALEAGELDCVVGTHALFGVSCAKLGIVIIDEEHKFGVKQKEKLKSLYENVHLLSMSATPIPRSLNQALSSIKTMSELLTPPSERLGVTDVCQKLR
jgi:transcription-repair coupling factor (superfamily II helicase)